MAWNRNRIAPLGPPLDDDGLSSSSEHREQRNDDDDGKNDPDPEAGLEDAGDRGAAGQGQCQQEHEQDPRKNTQHEASVPSVIMDRAGQRMGFRREES
jgi:hypothetical protein